MSDITKMNATLRRRVTYWGAGMALLGALAIAPQAAGRLLQGDPTKELWWIALIGAFAVLNFLVEGLDLGKRPRHRADVDRLIANSVVADVCANPACPEKPEPTEGSHKAALDLFYTKVDSGSRAVAFNHWGWYYFSSRAFWLAVAGLVLAVALSIKFATDALGWRIVFLCLLAGSALLAHLMRKKWTTKTRDTAQSQLAQIKGSMGSNLPGNSCPSNTCPC